MFAITRYTKLELIEQLEQHTDCKLQYLRSAEALPSAHLHIQVLTWHEALLRQPNSQSGLLVVA